MQVRARCEDSSAGAERGRGQSGWLHRPASRPRHCLPVRSQVVLGWHRLSGLPVAIKSYTQGALRDPIMKKFLQREVATLSRLWHPNVVGLLEAVRMRRGLHIVFECLSRGSLQGVMRRLGDKKRGLPEARAWGIFRQLAPAVAYIHSEQVVHRDLKVGDR